MGNAQTSVCFRVAWKRSEDPNDARAVKKLWPIDVVDIDLQPKILKDYMVGKKVAIIVNVAS
jgi:hypothetical protein